MRTTKRVFLFLILVATIIFIVVLFPIPDFINFSDFSAYWSASYLLGRGENFTNPELLLATEHAHSYWTGSFTLMTWNPPWLLVLLLPYTLFPFTRAAQLWFWTNLVMLFTGTMLLWRVLARKPETTRFVWLASLIAFTYSPTLLTLMMGQINTLVFFGLALFLYFDEQDKPFTAGFSLALTLVKPHLVYIALPLILLSMWRKRRLRVFAGLASAILFLTAVALLLRPTMVQDYVTTIANGNLFGYLPATLSGFLTGTIGWQWSKFALLLALPITILLWFRWRDDIDLYSLTSMGLLASIISSPFGWSYDFVVLLIPILQMTAWLVEREYGRWQTWLFASLLIAINVASFAQRVIGANEMYYFWIPIAISIVYAMMYWKRNTRTNPPSVDLIAG